MQENAETLAFGMLIMCCSVLQCVAVCCSGLQCVAVCCSVLQCVVTCVFPKGNARRLLFVLISHVWYMLYSSCVLYVISVMFVPCCISNVSSLLSQSCVLYLLQYVLLVCVFIGISVMCVISHTMCVTCVFCVTYNKYGAGL